MQAFVIVKLETTDFLNIFLLGRYILWFSSGEYRIKCCLVHAGIVTL